MKTLDRSFLKWPGNKFQLLKKIYRHIPKTGNVLVEPFAGSCVFALNTNYKHYVLADVNPDLINLFKTIVNHTEEFIDACVKEFIPENYNEEIYYSRRDAFNNMDFDFNRAVTFYWLLRHGFNGLVRYNKGGIYNVPIGIHEKPIIAEDRIRLFAIKFKSTDFVLASYEDLLAEAWADATIFCDPPYLPLKKTSNFTSYAPTQFKDEDHSKLDYLCHYNSTKGNKVFVCNHRVPKVDELYSLSTSHVNYFCQRTISAKGESRVRVKETLLKY